jgi:hypothetical protein
MLGQWRVTLNLALPGGVTLTPEFTYIMR